jgi:hypothetical protein
MYLFTTVTVGNALARLMISFKDVGGADGIFAQMLHARVAAVDFIVSTNSDLIFNVSTT